MGKMIWHIRSPSDDGLFFLPLCGIRNKEVYFMKTIDLHWRDKRELSRILNGLRALGYENADGLTPKYRFPVIVVDLEGRRFFRSHASFMAAGIARGTSDLREWDEVADVISAHGRSPEGV